MRKGHRCSCKCKGNCCKSGSSSVFLIVTIGVTVGFMMAYAVRALFGEE